MLLYLPLLLVTRFVIAFNLESEDSKKDTPISYEAFALIIVDVTATILPLKGIGKVILLLIGIALLWRVAILLMPEHTFS